MTDNTVYWSFKIEIKGVAGKFSYHKYGTHIKLIDSLVEIAPSCGETYGSILDKVVIARRYSYADSQL